MLVRNRTSGAQPRTPEQQVGKTIAELRRANGWTQAALGERLGRLGYPMHQSAIAKIESAGRPLRVNELAALARIFGVSPGDLFDPHRHISPEVKETAAFRRVWEELLDATNRFEAASRLAEEAEMSLSEAEGELDRAQKAFDRFTVQKGKR